MSRAPEARALGRSWEAKAAKFLESQGLKILDRGYSCRLGELDIIATDSRHLIIVEVKARASSSSAIHTIDRHKRRRIIDATRHFLMRNPTWFSANVRFDVIGIDAIDSEAPEFSWVKNAFDAG